jgi:cellulose synthase/poly-beta-1,6-N-acetylglucosamine synthase-like glycosyltransferase
MAYRGGDGGVIDPVRRNSWNTPAGIPSLVPALPREFAGDLQAEVLSHRCPEIDCVRHLLSPKLLVRAEAHAEAIGVTADHVLITSGILSEEAYVAALATSLGIPFEPLFNTPRERCPQPDEVLSDAANTGMLPLLDSNGVKIVVAPRLVDSRRLISVATSGAEIARRIRLTSTARLHDFVTRHTTQEIERRAVDDLRRWAPDLSAGVHALPRFWTLACVTALALTSILMPSMAIPVVEIGLATIFLAWTGLRLFGLWSGDLLRRQPQTLADEELPTYSILIALYREAAAVPGLAKALSRLNYPAEKLDIKFVVEPDDHETRAAIDRLKLGPPFETRVAPAGGPRTKPKALNAVLPFVRGAFVAVFDAEDRPERDQLRIALEAFAANGERLACVQARLTIDNTVDSWLTRVFTAEYAGLFDVFLPGLAAWRLPLPLGGSSNHFRSAVLRQIGAWDPYNVTEDADLGMRLARLGYFTGVISSTTYEEAPARFHPWLRQRTRWFKGWMQTWLVHMRSPILLARELGWKGYLVFQLLVGGTVLAALIHVPFATHLAWRLVSASPEDPMSRTLLAFEIVGLVSGYVTSGVLGAYGLSRRRLLGSAWVLLLMPVYWILLSLAAWRALFQFLYDPYRWEKTEHGLARTSRREVRDSA